MAWMPVDQFLPSHPKTARLARELGWTPRYACGFLLELWGWAINHQPDGYIERADRAALAQGVRMSREELAKVTRALREVGWVDTAGPEQGRLHEWEEWGGKIVERRKADRVRQERNRAKKGTTEPSSRVTSDGQSVHEQAVEIVARLGSRHGDVTRDVTRDVRTQTRQDKRETRQEPPSPTATAAEQQGTTGLEDQAEQLLNESDGLWRTALTSIRSGAGSDRNFITYFKSVRLELRGDRYYVVAPNTFARDWILSKWQGLVTASIGVLINEISPDVRVVTEAEVPAAEGAQA
jgi:hypothetical protein